MRKKYLNISYGTAYIKCNDLITSAPIYGVGIPFWYNDNNDLASKAIEALKKYVEAKYPGWEFLSVDEVFKYEISDEEYSDAYKDNGRGYYDPSENKCPEGVFEAELVGHDFLDYDEFVEGTEYESDAFTFVVLDFKINNEIYKFRVKLFDYDYSDGEIEEYFSWVKCLAVKTIKDESNLDSIFYGTKNKKYQIKIYYKNGNRIDFNHKPKLIVESTNKNTVKTDQIKDDIYIIGVRFATQTRGCYYYRCKKPEYKVGDTLFVPTQYGNKEARVVFVRTYKDKNEVLQDTKYPLDILKWAPEKKTLSQEELKKIEQERLAKEKAEKERLERERQERIRKEEEERQERIRKEEENKKKILEEKTKIRNELISLKNKYKKESYSSINFQTITNLISNFEKKLDSEKYLSHKQDYNLLIIAVKEVKTLEQEEADRKRKKKIAIILSTILAIILMFIFIKNVVVPSIKYSSAITLIEKGDYDEAEDILYDLGDYKEAEIYIKLIDVKKQCDRKEYTKAINNLESLGGTSKFSINFDGGVESNNYIYLYGEKIKTGQKEGYTFKEYITSGYKLNVKNKVLTIEVKAVYSINQYSITYHLNGGTVKDTNPSSYNVETETFMLNEPIKTGYEFTGWTNNDSATPSKNFNIYKGTTGNLVFYANYKTIEYKIEYELNGGVNNSKNINSFNIESKNITIYQPSRTGYTFDGWSVNGSTKLYKTYVIESGTTDNIKLEAKWTIVEYSIVYELNGGENHYDNPAGYSVDTDTFVIKSPSKVGYTFIGWTTLYADTPVIDPEITKGTTGDLTYIAHWEANDYTITFDANGGVVDKTSMSVTYDDSFTLPVPSRTGYTFKYWMLNGSEYSDEIYKETKNIKLVAKWEANDYVITYDVNGGNPLPKSYMNISYDDSFTLPVPSRTGYTFKYWILSGSEYTDEVYKETKNITLVAKWEANDYTITFDANGGSVDKTTMPVTYDDSFTLPEPTRTGYTFKYWTLNGEEYKSGTYKETKNITLVAKWEANDYVITYDANGGELQKYNQVVEYDSEIKLYEPTRTGYTFKYWTLNGEEYKSGTYKEAEDIILIAEWEANIYKVRYFIDDELLYEDEAIYDEIYQLKSSFKNGDDTLVKWKYEDTYYDPNEEFDYNMAKDIELYTLFAYVNEDFTFKMSTTTTATITGYSGTDTDIRIPEYICDNGKYYKVSSISLSGSGITSITMSNNITVIERGCFNYATSLVDFYYNGTIEDWCNIYIKRRPHSLGFGVDYYDNNNPMEYAENFYLLNENGSVEHGIFKYELLTDLVIPETVSQINSCQFYGFKMKNLILPSSVTNIDLDAFVGCINLENVYYNGTIEDWCSIRFYDYHNGGSYAGANPMVSAENFYILDANGDVSYNGLKYNLLTTLIIPETISEIGDMQFKGFECITTLIVLENVKSINSYAFANCNFTVVFNNSNIDLTPGHYFITEPTKVYSKGQWELIDGVPTPLV